ncbi:C-X-C chemokine receptor type 1-like [Alosa sapidissima]|uniref:C-X-C chemokine receptor type 1-like n=1 Tax=Alosa sapidissima TaxID=34773 RepID=UPI001C09962F|nr:C-X-C chemokine receptor type 1-like [Alosa sapidissima]
MAGSFKLDFDDELYEELNLSEHSNFSIEFLNEDTFSCRPRPLPTITDIFICVFYLLVFAIAVPGNLVVCLVVGSSKQRLSPSDLYLFHLAVADLLLALSLPFWAASMPSGWLFGTVACKLTSMLMEVNFYTSILFLVCISVDRYLAVVRAGEAKGGGWRGPNSRPWNFGTCAGVWFLGVLLSLPTALHNEVFRPTSDGSGKEICSEHFEMDSAPEWRLATRVLRHLLGFLLPLLTMLACYGATALRLWRTRCLQRLRAMRVIAAVVAAFLLCWCPQHLGVVVDTLMRAKLLDFDCVQRQAADQAVVFTQMLAFLHCCVNPVLYAFIGVKFRRNLQRLIQKRSRKRAAMDRPGMTRLFSRSSSNMSQDGSLTLM